ncbi:SGNH hydrolase-type esterase domain-containing protein [Xylaria cf. heliscus]|nr:SGNH hydrolase-type esterase domain-containing protein [Xylaria cf. heliscus]
MMRSSSFSKVLTVLGLILALIGVFTYNVVDYDKYVRRLAKSADSSTGNGNDNPSGSDSPSSDNSPSGNNSPDGSNSPSGNNSPNSNDGPVAEVIPLRLMFMGASITRGEVSTGDRGYRKHIRDTVISWGKEVNLVGFNRFGDWEDNDVEGWGAFRIRTITKHARQSVPALQPNLVLVQVGTSDCFQKDDIANIGPRMRILIDAILEGEPRATVIMSTLATTPSPEFEPCIVSANSQIRQVAADLIRENKTVALSEMHYDQGLPGRPRPEDIGPDKIHPTDDGYIMMGDIFLESIREVEGKGFLQRAANNSIPDNGDDGREVEDAIKEKTEKEDPIDPKRRRRMP